MATHSSVLAGESQGRRSLVGCCLWGHTGPDRTEASSHLYEMSNTVKFIAVKSRMVVVRGLGPGRGR